MIVKSIYPVLEDAEVPDGCRVEKKAPEYSEGAALIVWAKRRDGTEYRLMEDSSFRDGSRPSRRWYDEKGRLHRNEKDGPAHIEPPRQRSYFKHGKHHRIGGPAFYTATSEQLYYLEGKELTKTLWEVGVQAGGKAPRPPRIDLPALCAKAAELSAQARQAGSVGGHTIPQDELSQLDLASKAKNWKRHGTPELTSNGSVSVCLNCTPLDDTLRCYLVVNDAGIVAANLEVE